MKKLLTVLLTVFMAFTLVTVNVSADTYNKGWGFSWRKFNTEAVEEVKEEEPVVEEVQEEVSEAVVAEEVEVPVVEEMAEEEAEVEEVAHEDETVAESNDVIPFDDILKKYLNTGFDFDGEVAYTTYDGTSKKPLQADANGYVAEGIRYYPGNLLEGYYANSATNAGKYKGCLVIENGLFDDYTWDNGSIYHEIEWEIKKAPVQYDELVKYVGGQKLIYNATLQQPELLSGINFASLANTPFVTEFDCIAIDQNKYTALVYADNNHELVGVPEDRQKEIDYGFLGKMTYAKLDWRIERAVIIEIAVKNATKEYGDIDPTFDVDLEGVFNETDKIAIRALLIRNEDNTRMKHKDWPVGTYKDEAKVVVNKDKDGKQKSYTNYKFADGVEESQIPGTLTITKAPLTFYLNVTQRDYSYTPIVLVRGLKNAEKLVENVDYEVERYDEGNEPEEFKPGDYTTKESGTKCVKIHLKGTIKANNYDTGHYVEEDGKKVWEHLDYVVLEYQISEPTPKVTPKVPTAKEAKAVIIRTVTSIIKNLSTKRFGR